MKRILYSLLFLLLVTECRAQKVKLALNLVKGNTYNLISSATSVINQNINGQTNNITLNISGTMAFKVLNTNDSLYFMEVVYKSVAMKMQLPNGPVAYDSQKKDTTDIMSTMLAHLTNQPFTAVFTKSGKIRSVENVENMIASVFDGFPQIQGPQREQVKKQFIDSFGAKAIKGSIEMGTAVFPETAVTKNDKWTVNTTLQGTMTAGISMVYQLTAVTPASYVIHGDGRINTDDKADYKELNGLPMKYNMTGTMLADITADKKTGWISRSTIKQEITGTVAIKDNPKVPGGITFPMSLSSETVTTDK